MPVPFSAEDFDRVFDSAIIRRAQSVIALGFVNDVTLQGDTIDGIVEDMDGTRRTTSLTPERKGSRVPSPSGNVPAASAAAGIWPPPRWRRWRNFPNCARPSRRA